MKPPKPAHGTASVAPAPSSAKSVERWGLVTARDIMRDDVITVSYAAPLTEVERVLSENRISGAPVTDEMGRIVGVVSLKDLIERYTEDPDAQPRRGNGFYHLSSEETLDDDFESFEIPEEAEETASDVMTAEVYSVPAGAGLKEIAATMKRHGIHRVLVEENGKHIGLISTLEVLAALSA
jgi:CBS domain-containing protein